ncbi:MAG: penicillin acylase family protein [Planktomarina sp.]|jgi:penicillin amidase|nr:penicillin acylase family protein [Planktomarina sp.]MDT2057202.1 penicillin acylase family protein [Planktomarina sp.]|tara:strand:+ start:5697 stop:8174 length:2478 start_codon:yes stop_codon:yes gene_type:complete
MERIFVWLVRITLSVAAFSVLILFFIYFFLSQSLPNYNKTVQFSDLIAKTEVVRDTANVPHIFGTNDHDTLFALGYVHAQDRLWQMTMLRRTAQGRLSELFGEKTLSIDKVVRRLGIYSAAHNSISALRPSTQLKLNAYAQGVNARLKEINSGALGRGAPEFFIFSNAIARWSPADSLAIIKLMGLQMSSHLESEVLRARLSLILDNDRLKDILPDVPGPGQAILNDFASLFPTLPRLQANENMPQQAFSPFKPIALSGASNAWAALPGRSASRGTLLANDPHLSLTAPSIWYLARLELETGGVIGGTIPGVPVVLVGRSAHLGWGLTTANIDDTDVYIEKVNPNNPNEYLSLNEFVPFIKKQSIIKIKDSISITIDLLWTENGPVLPSSHYNLGAITPEGYVTSVAWTLLSANDTSIEAAFDIMASHSVQSAMKASRTYIAPGQNLTLADRNQIAMRTIGALPKRDPRNQSRGRMPTAGWLSVNRWQGMFDQSVNPVFLNPIGGVLGNTNNKYIDRPFPEHISYDWSDTQRVQRWVRLMQNREAHTRDSFIEAQLDSISSTARTILPLIGAELWFQSKGTPFNKLLEQRKVALNLLANWNGEMNEHLPEPLIYSAWIRALQVRLVQDELGPLSKEFSQVKPLFIERVYRNIDGAGQWCDVVQSEPIETCAAMAQLALDDALTELLNTYSNDIDGLRWGEAHQATHDHPVLGKIPVLKWFVNIRHSTSGGDNTLQRGKTIGTGPNPYLNVHAGAYRGVYDFADPDSSVFIISTGQSGHPLSRHYDNLAELWRRGEYVPMSLDESLARAGATGVTTLSPTLANIGP